MLTKLKMFRYYNCNPKGRRVDDCVIRAISLAENKTWEETYDELSYYAKQEGILLNDVTFVDKYLENKYKDECYKCNGSRATVKEFLIKSRTGTYLIAMQGHITCVKDGIIYDTWDCSNKRIWKVWEIE